MDKMATNPGLMHLAAKVAVEVVASMASALSIVPVGLR
jgi:hypothetical protein